MKIRYKPVGNRNGNVANRQKYYTSLDLLKFDQIISQKSHKGVYPSDLDMFLEHNAFFVFGEVKHEGVYQGRKYEIMRDALVEFHSGFGFFAESLPNVGLRSVHFVSQFIDTKISADMGWDSASLYAALSVYSQLMWLFANTYVYGHHPDIKHYTRDKSELTKRTNHLFIDLVMEIVDQIECRNHILLPEHFGDVYQANGHWERCKPVVKILEELFATFDECLPV